MVHKSYTKFQCKFDQYWEQTKDICLITHKSSYWQRN